MKKKSISVKRYIKVLMHAGIFISILSINSCSKDDIPLGMESDEYYPLTIEEVSFFTGNAAAPIDSSSTNRTKSSAGLITSVSSFSEYLSASGHMSFNFLNSEQQKHKKCNSVNVAVKKSGCIFSSDSSIYFSGCSSWNNEKKQNPENADYNNNSLHSKNFIHGYEKSQTKTNILRSAEDNLKSKGIGIFRLSGTNHPAAQNNIHYAYNYDESDWNPSDKSNPVYLGKAEATLCAYYPYNTASINGNVTLTSQLYSNDADLCYQTGKTASSESGDVSFTLNHAYVKITFIFKREESYKGNGAVSKIIISGENILSSNILDIKTGIYDTGTPGKVSVNPGISSIPSRGTASAEVLLVPVEELTNKVTFTFTIDGIESMGVFSPSVEEFNKFEAGKNYTIKIDLTSNLVIVSGETANCYMLPPGSIMQIPVNVKGNGKQDAVAGTGIDVHHTVASVGILWETSVNLITIGNFNSSEQTATVVTNSLTETGNAVIAAYSGAKQTGDILWSWHIWVTDYYPAAKPVKNGNIYTIANTNGSYTWMDRNIGATTITSATTTTLGLLYQWGRKDPFQGAGNYTGISNNTYISLPIYNKTGTLLTEESGTTGTGIKHKLAVATTSDKTLNLKNSIKNPMMFYFGVNGSEIGYDWYTVTNDRQYQNSALWGGANNTNPTDKTIFDPCPPGWRVPAWNAATPWSAFNNASTFTWAAANYGRTYNGKTFYPAAGYRHCGSGALYYVGSYGLYWSASISSTEKYSCSLYFYSNGVGAFYDYNRAYGFSVRCVQE